MAERGVASPLQREACAATARRRRIRIADLEGRADQVVDKVDLRAAEKANRDWIDDDSRTDAFEHNVVGGFAVACDKIEFVLEARTAAALNADAQHRVVGIFRQDLVDPLGGAFRQNDVCFFDICCHKGLIQIGCMIEASGATSPLRMNCLLLDRVSRRRVNSRCRGLSVISPNWPENKGFVCAT